MEAKISSIEGSGALGAGSIFNAGDDMAASSPARRSQESRSYDEPSPCEYGIRMGESKESTVEIPRTAV
jgi:hypothetical protein